MKKTTQEHTDLRNSLHLENSISEQTVPTVDNPSPSSRPIHSWSEEERPREKLMAKGVRALSDAELLAILVGSGTAKESAVDMMRRVLERYENNLFLLGRASISELTRIKGIGPAKATTLLAAMELSNRQRVQSSNLTHITCSEDAAKIMGPLLIDSSYEEFWVLLLNRGNRILHKYLVGKGGVAGVAVDTHAVMREAIIRNATAIIICHNHPSGQARPSREDKRVTETIARACQALKISLLDHVIVANDKHYSFTDHDEESLKVK